MAGAESFPKEERIRRRAEYLAVQGGDAGRSVHKLPSRSFLACVAPAMDAGAPTRFGITASKKVGGAVERNRARRLVREVVRRHKGNFPRGTDVVFIVRREIMQTTYSALSDEIRKLCARLAPRSA